MVKNPPAKAGNAKRHRFHSLVRKILWSRKWQLTPVFLPGKFHGQRSLAGSSPWGHKESDRLGDGTHTHTHTHTPLLIGPQPAQLWLVSAVFEEGEGNGTPLQYSCLENPMDGGAW